MKHRSRIFALAAAGGLIAGLGLSAAGLDAQATAQATAQARVYQLVSVDGQALPVTAEEEDGCREEITGATLTLEEGGAWRLEVAEREVCGDAVEEETEGEEGTYTTEGETVRFAEDDADDEAGDDEGEADDEGEEDELELDDLEVGTLDASGLTVRIEGVRSALFRPETG